jgi:hypothetical protein
MGLLDIVRSGVAIANTLTVDLQAIVIREAAFLPLTQDVRGEPNRAAGVNVPALVEMKQRMVKLATGEIIASRAKVTFLDPAIVIHVKDRLTLPDGSQGPILEVEGLVDRSTGKSILSEVFIGS